MRVFWSVFLVAGFFAGGCNDDFTRPDSTPFAVNLEVADPDGAPVEGLEARLHVFLPPEVLPFAGKPAVRIPFSVADTSMVSLIVYDLDDNVVKTLLKGSVQPGWHVVVLAKDDDGDPLMGTHLYRCEMVAVAENVERFRGETFLTLYTSIDLDQRPVLGISDRRGRIRYGKRSDFPYLYSPGPQMSLDENGQPRGNFEFIEKVEITLIHPGLGLSLNREVIIGQGINKVNLVWDPRLASKPRPLAEQGSPEVGEVGRGVISEPVRPPFPLEYSLGPGIPNPFN